MRVRFFFARFLAVLVAAVLLAGSAPVSAAAQSATPTTPNFDLALTPGVVPTIFGDVEVPETPARVITLTDGALDAVISIGVAPVGATSSANFESAAAYLADRVPADLTYVGGWGELDIEAIVALSPDLILADRYLTEDVYATLSEIAPVISPQEIAVDGAFALQQWEYELLVWGHALNKDADAVAAVSDLRAAAADLKAQLAGHNGESVVVFRPQPEGPVVMSHQWMTGVMLTWAGFGGTPFTEEMAPPHGGQSSYEQLAELNADWLFLAARDQEQRDMVANYEKNPLFATLDAAKSGQYFVVSGDLWSGATGVQAGYAMLADIARLIGGIAAGATPAA
jgi:iron complex transport system substrate-binding protein